MVYPLKSHHGPGVSCIVIGKKVMATGKKDMKSQHRSNEVWQKAKFHIKSSSFECWRIEIRKTAFLYYEQQLRTKKNKLINQQCIRRFSRGCFFLAFSSCFAAPDIAIRTQRSTKQKAVSEMRKSERQTDRERILRRAEPRIPNGFYMSGKATML